MSETTSPPDEPAEPNEVPPGFDLAGGDLRESDRTLINDAIAEGESRRSLRRTAFYVGGSVVLALLCVVTNFLIGLARESESLAILTHAHDWHFLPVISLIIVALTAIPLSLGLALIRLISPPPAKTKHDDVAFTITTPQLELLKWISSFWKSGH